MTPVAQSIPPGEAEKLRGLEMTRLARDGQIGLMLLHVTLPGSA